MVVTFHKMKNIKSIRNKMLLHFENLYLKPINPDFEMTKNQHPHLQLSKQCI